MLQPRGSCAGRAQAFFSSVSGGARGRALPEGGLAGGVSQHARRSCDLAEGSREGRARGAPARPRVAGIGGRGGEKGLRGGGEPQVARGSS